MKNRITNLILIIAIFASIIGQILVDAKAFNDVPTSHKYYEAINTLSDLGIFGEGSENIFYPENTLTKAEMATLLCRSLYFDLCYDMINPYTDVDETYWYYDSVMRLTENKIVDVEQDRLFGPNYNIRYIEALQWMVNALGYKDLAISLGGLPSGYETVATNIGLIANINITNNSQPLTRGDAAQLLYNAMKPQLDNSTGTSVSGIIDNDTTWSKTNNPYIVNGNILVDVDATLTIEAGVEIYFSGDYYIQIKGVANFNGTEADEIMFGRWSNNKYIFSATIDLKSDSNILSHCKIKGNLNIYSSNNYISNSTIVVGGITIGQQYTVSATQNIIENCTVFGACTGISFTYTKNNKVLNSTITNCSEGVKFSDSSGNNIETTIIKNGKSSYEYTNGVGINMYYYSDGNNLSKCELTDLGVGIKYNTLNSENINSNIFNNSIGNCDYGILVHSGKVNIQHNNIYSNNKYNISNQGTNEIVATNNYWGTINKSEISAKIFDFFVDFNKGKVAFEPYLTKPFNDGYVVSNKNSGTFTAPIEISLSAIGDDYLIYYTLDGSNPTVNGTQYTVPITLNSNTVLKAVTKKNNIWSEIQEYQYIFNIIPENLAYIISKIKLYDTNENLINDIPTADDFFIRTEIKKNNKYNNEILIISTYDENNRLISLHTNEEFLQSGIFKGETNTYTKFIKNNNISKIKVFIWNGINSLIPASNMAIK